MNGRATIAKITAQRMGCSDPQVLKLIEKLASADLKLKSTRVGKVGVTGTVFQSIGTLDGKEFVLTISGEALADLI